MHNPPYHAQPKLPRTKTQHNTQQYPTYHAQQRILPHTNPPTTNSNPTHHKLYYSLAQPNPTCPDPDRLAPTQTDLSRPRPTCSDPNRLAPTQNYWVYRDNHKRTAAVMFSSYRLESRPFGWVLQIVQAECCACSFILYATVSSAGNNTTQGLAGIFTTGS